MSCHGYGVPGKSLNAGGGWAPKSWNVTKEKVRNDCKLYKKFWCTPNKDGVCQKFPTDEESKQVKPGYFFSNGDPPNGTCIKYNTFEQCSKQCSGYGVRVNHLMPVVVGLQCNKR